LVALNDEIEYRLTDNAVLSMPGGFDSRVLLGSFLKQGCSPLLLTTGSEESSDVLISQQIASDIGLEISVVPLEE